MARITSKLQVTIPKALAEKYAMKPGDEIEFQAAGPVIRVIPAGRQGRKSLSAEERLRLFDEATERQRRREAGMQITPEPERRRDWKREDLYTRGEPD